MAGHTPGPWEVGLEIIGAVDDHGLFTRHVVAKITPARLRRQRVQPEQVAADYRLIAAAPELLEALLDLMPERLIAADEPAMDEDEYWAAVDRARIVIAKACE